MKFPGNFLSFTSYVDIKFQEQPVALMNSLFYSLKSGIYFRLTKFSISHAFISIYCLKFGDVIWTALAESPRPAPFDLVFFSPLTLSQKQYAAQYYANFC